MTVGVQEVILIVAALLTAVEAFHGRSFGWAGMTAFIVAHLF